MKQILITGNRRTMQLYEWLRRAGTAKFTGFFLLLLIINNLLCSLFLPGLDNPWTFDNADWPSYALMSLLFSPFTETWLLQYLVIKGLQKLNCRNGPAVFISAIIFGLAHIYSYSYQLFAFGGGLIYGTAFVLLQKRRQYAFLLTAFLHFLYNLAAVLYLLVIYLLEKH